MNKNTPNEKLIQSLKEQIRVAQEALKELQPDEVPQSFKDHFAGKDKKKDGF